MAIGFGTVNPQKFIRIRREVEIDRRTGRPQQKSEVRTEVEVSLQPAPGEVVDRLGSGFRQDDLRLGISMPEHDFRAADPDATPPVYSDFLETLDGSKRWEVQEVGEWLDIPEAAHYATIFVRVRENI